MYNHLITYIVTIVLLISFLAFMPLILTASDEAEESKPLIVYESRFTEIEKKINQAFGDKAEIMRSIAYCESGTMQHKPSGEVVVSYTNDYGLFQINHLTWNETANQMGLDYINNIDDNIAMAQHILEVQGLTAWVCYKKLYLV